MISAVVLAHNEEHNIDACLKSLGWCDEILVIDDFSPDRTAEISRSLGAKVFPHKLNNNFSAQRNFALSKATNVWVLFADADERVTPELADEIKQVINSKTEQNGFYLYRKDNFWGKWIEFGDNPRGEKSVGLIKLLRLARKTKGHWKGRVHERWEINGKTSTLLNPIQHYPHPTLKEFFEEINWYSTIRASELADEGKRTNFLEMLTFPIGKFIKGYIVGRGFMDGPQGLVLHAMMACHSFLVRYKLLLLQIKANK